MQKTKEVARAGKRMGKKVMATDTAQDVVEVLVDGLEEVVVDKADDAGDALKVRAARAGGRAPKPTTAKKSTAKKSTAQEVDGQEVDGQEVDGQEVDGQEVDGQEVDRPRSRRAKKSTAKKSTAKKSTAGTSKAQRR